LLSAIQANLRRQQQLRQQQQPQQQQPASVATDNGLDHFDSHCPRHGNGRDIINKIRNFSSHNEGPPVPMLKALMSDQSLLDTCTCSRPPQNSRPTHQQQQQQPVQQRSSEYEDYLNRLSNGQQRSALADQPAGNIVRPMSWHSEQFNLDHQLRFFPDLDIGGPGYVTGEVDGGRLGGGGGEQRRINGAGTPRVGINGHPANGVSDWGRDQSRIMIHRGASDVARGSTSSRNYAGQSVLFSTHGQSNSDTPVGGVHSADSY